MVILVKKYLAGRFEDRGKKTDLVGCWWAALLIVVRAGMLEFHDMLLNSSTAVSWGV